MMICGSISMDELLDVICNLIQEKYRNFILCVIVNNSRISVIHDNNAKRLWLSDIVLKGTVIIFNNYHRNIEIEISNPDFVSQLYCETNEIITKVSAVCRTELWKP